VSAPDHDQCSPKTDAASVRHRHAPSWCGECDSRKRANISVYTMRIARVNVYLPDDLAEKAKQAGLNVSALTQDAIRMTLAQESTEVWLESLVQLTPHSATHEYAIDAP
jgi:post-segregation antitoxin (ccd killing protein)